MSETTKELEVKKADKIEGIQVLADTSLTFEHPREDVHIARMRIAGCGWVDTDDGVVLVDTLYSKEAAKKTLDKIHEISKIEYIIYTHGHLDHVIGCEVFMADQPQEVIASRYLPDRLDRYKMLAPHKRRIAVQQFNLSERQINDKRASENWVYPTKTFLGEMILSLGGKTFELRTARAETDDVCWVWIPEIKTAFIGDLVIRGFPNVGNPWKPTRFALDWAKTLEEVRAKEPELLLCNGAGIVYHGYFDHNPAHLLPRPEREVNAEIFNLIGDAQAILDRARELLAQGLAQLGLQVLEVLIQADPGNVDARKLRIEILEELGSADYCLMSRNAWVYFINKDREFLRSKSEL